MNPEFLAILSLSLWVVVPIATFAARHWLIALISKGVQHHFDVELEKVRAELGRSREQFKSELTIKENEIAALRKAVLSGSSGRQTLLDKRRFKAVQRVWTAVNDMAQSRMLAGMMAAINFKEVAKDPRSSDVMKLIGVLEAAAPNPKDIKNVARDERPFLPELAWAYFSAYTTIVLGSNVRLQVLKIGMPNADSYLSGEGPKKIIKAALPDFSGFIDEHEPETYYYLLDEIERCLLAELRKILEGKEADQAGVVRAMQIMSAVNQEQAEQAAKAPPV